jgi:integrase
MGWHQPGVLGVRVIWQLRDRLPLRAAAVFEARGLNTRSSTVSEMRRQICKTSHHPLPLVFPSHDAAGIAEDRKGWLFRTARGHKADRLSDRAMNQSDAWCMIRRRAKAAGIAAEIGCHTFRATGITAYLANGGALEHAQEMAAHESPRTTKLYDRTKERLTQDEVERIRL